MAAGDVTLYPNNTVEQIDTTYCPSFVEAFAFADRPTLGSLQKGAIAFTTDGIGGNPGLCFWDGSVWKEANTPADTIATS